MTCLFDDESQQYFILVNAYNQHSIWPHSLPLPDGWQAIHGPAERCAAVHFVDQHWTDLRPATYPATRHQASI